MKVRVGRVPAPLGLNPQSGIDRPIEDMILIDTALARR
jgi:hypothetical protein